VSLLITNIQRFCLHDGPGIRTTVFFKGCNLRCPWCSNPENIEFKVQEYDNDGKIEKYGYEISLEDLEQEILKDKAFYGEEGGVTLSGGDAILHLKEVEELLKRLKSQGINICIETSLTSPEYLVDIAIKYVDIFIIDIKILDEENIKSINGDVKLYLKNIKKVFDNKCKVIFRIPLVSNYTVTDKNIEKILELLDVYKPIKVEIFKVHSLAEKKYKTLNKELPVFDEITEEKISQIKQQIEDLGIVTEYCKI